MRGSRFRDQLDRERGLVWFEAPGPCGCDVEWQQSIPAPAQPAPCTVHTTEEQK